MTDHLTDTIAAFLSREIPGMGLAAVAVAKALAADLEADYVLVPKSHTLAILAGAKEEAAKIPQDRRDKLNQRFDDAMDAAQFHQDYRR